MILEACRTTRSMLASAESRPPVALPAFEVSHDATSAAAIKAAATWGRILRKKGRKNTTCNHLTGNTIAHPPGFQPYSGDRAGVVMARLGRMNAVRPQQGNHGALDPRQ